MREKPLDPAEPGHAVRAALAAADARRRSQAAGHVVWRLAPAVAGAALVLSIVRRWTSWTPWLPLSVLLLGAATLGIYVFTRRRPHEVSDDTAAAIDGEAALRGELRSASWFARRQGRNEWADHHLARAAARLERVDWAALYPAPRATKARAATAAMAITALALTVALPERVSGRRAASNPAVDAPKTADGRTLPGEVLPPELLAQLQALLAAAEMGNTTEAERLASSAELRELLNRLAADPDLLKKLASALAAKDPAKAPTAAEMKAMAERARKAAELSAMSQDMREALEKMADQVDQDDLAKNAANDDGAEPAGAEGSQKGESAQSSAASGMQELSVQMSRQADTGGAAGIMMMANPDDQGAGPPGSGVGGSGSQEAAAAAAAAALAAAFKHEMVEAAQDNAGDNVETEIRRKTEQGTSAVAFTHGAAAQFDRSRAAAAPPVPEARRSGVQTYFVRKQ